MKIKIKKMRTRPFTGTDGETVPYFWYKGERPDGITVEFGSLDGGHEISDTFVELDIEKFESGKGFRYKEANKNED